MRSEEIKQEINKLGLAEKLLLVEDVWDSIAQSISELPMPEWQVKELDKRYHEYTEGKQNLHDWESVHEELRNKYK
ncbi:MAG: addiction module protein [Deltaproteobacteria bacterium]|nr:addiction module protein [Deltaproteobacteria bacterium]